MSRTLVVGSLVVALVTTLAALAAGCGGGAAVTTTGSDQGGASSSATTGAQGGGGAATSAASTVASSTSGQGGNTSSATSSVSTSASTTSGTGGGGGLATLGSLVVLGDSISDGGGQPPFYYNLLHTDLSTKYGNISYQNKAQSGSTTAKLVSQINGLPAALPGPVAVVITSGGNDMKAALPQIVLGADGPARMAMGNNIKAALDALLAPNRFGPGVQVHVFEGNVYDASDGKGDFGSHGCAFGGGLPPIPTDGFFNAWNSVILDQVTTHGQVQADMHMYFHMHGYSYPPDWFAPDCTHPSTLGHDQLRRLFYHAITGIWLP